MAIINFKLMSHPMNWLTILLMVVIAGAIGHMFLSYIGMEPHTQPKLAYSEMPAGQSPGEVAAGAIEPQYAAIPM